MERKAAASELANQILAQTDILQVIGERISLTRRGNSHIACCPFHDEKTPSFHVVPKNQYYYCFGCKASGNAIHFLREYDRMSFFEALKYLARQAGIEMPALEMNKPAVDASEYELLENVSHYFQQALRQSSESIDYLKGRGITGEVAKRFAIGFAPNSWDALLQSFNTSTDALDKLHRHGLIVTKDNGRRYDRFRNRVIFPIRDPRARTIAFGARTLGDDTPKYLNSPQTPLFHKSDALYGIHELQLITRNPPFILVVEGYMDVISLHQAGITSVVATLGTASNQAQLRRLQQYTDKIVICFDGDSAGQKAAWKALTEALPFVNERLDLRFLFLPEAEDPDSFVRKHGKTGMMDKIESSQTLSETFFGQLLAQHELSSLDGRARCAQAGLRIIETVPAGLLKSLLLKELADRLAIDLNSLESAQTAPLLREKEPTGPTKQEEQPPSVSQKPIPCILRALTLLLKESTLTQEQAIMESLSQCAHALTNPPRELKLLLACYQFLQTYPGMNTGQLINLFENPALQKYLLMLSAREESLSQDLIQAEYDNAIQLSIRWTQNAQIDQLINKSKSSGLSSDEQELLRKLLICRSKSSI